MLKGFNDGDLVQLKSGGQIMTVDHWDEHKGYYVCKWFDGPELKTEIFSAEILKQAEDNDNSSTKKTGYGASTFG